MGEEVIIINGKKVLCNVPDSWYVCNLEEEMYAAGVLECKGGFYVHKGKKRKKQYLGFKIIINLTNDKRPVLRMIKCLKGHGIIFRRYSNNRYDSFYITQQKVIQKLIQFITNYCYRVDFKQFTYDDELGWYKS